jgi:hypothetical protein
MSLNNGRKREIANNNPLKTLPYADDRTPEYFREVSDQQTVAVSG